MAKISKTHHRTKKGVIKRNPKKVDRVDLIIAYENGELSDNDTLKLFSILIKDGLVWNLQGSYGRTATTLIDNGYISKEGKILRQVS